MDAGSANLMYIGAIGAWTKKQAASPRLVSGGAGTAMGPPRRQQILPSLH